jgi:hypothetical protein
MENVNDSEEILLSFLREVFKRLDNVSFCKEMIIGDINKFSFAMNKKQFKTISNLLNGIETSNPELDSLIIKNIEPL